MLQKFQSLPLGVRMLLYMSVTYGTFMGLFFLTREGLTVGKAVAIGIVVLVAAVLYGLSMVITLGGAQVIATSRGGKEKADLSVRQKRSFFVMGTREEVHAVLREGMEALGVRSFDLDDAEAGVLTGHTRWSWKSFGENLGAVVKPRGDACQVTITSEPRLATTMVDYGKNRDNIRALEARLLDQVEVAEQALEHEPAAEGEVEPDRARLVAQARGIKEAP